MQKTHKKHTILCGEPSEDSGAKKWITSRKSKEAAQRAPRDIKTLKLVTGSESRSVSTCCPEKLISSQTLRGFV